MKNELFIVGNPSQIQLLMQSPVNAHLSIIDLMRGTKSATMEEGDDALVLGRNGQTTADGEEDVRRFATDIASRVNGLVRKGFCHHVSLLLPEPLLGHILEQLNDVTQRALSGVANVELSDDELPPHGASTWDA